MCKIVVTKNSVNSFCSCRRQYDYKVNKGISPVETPKGYDNAVALSKAVISSIVSYQSKHSVDEALNKGLELINGFGLEVTEGAQVEAAFRAYVCRYYNADNENWEVIDNTIDACVDVQASPNVVYKTYLNCVVRNKTKNQYFVVLNRTVTSKIDDSFIVRYLIDNDIRMQVLAAKQLLGIENCGVIVNAIYRQAQTKMKEGETDEEYAARNAARKSKADLKRKVGETRDEFVERMVADYPTENLRKFFVSFTDAQLTSAVSNVLAIASDIMSCKAFYPNTAECTKNGRCPYMSLCKCDGDLSKCSDEYKCEK